LKICCVLLNPAAKPPAKDKSLLDAGYDLFTPEAFVIEPGERRTIVTGVIVWMEPVVALFSWYLRLAEKSGLASKHGIALLGGVADRGYCGPTDELKVVLLNTGKRSYGFAAGAAICQIVPELIATTENMIAEVRSETPKLESRGGLGSGSDA
jgi:dUTP pyrophosphatase